MVDKPHAQFKTKQSLYSWVAQPLVTIRHASFEKRGGWNFEPKNKGQLKELYLELEERAREAIKLLDDVI